MDVRRVRIAAGIAAALVIGLAWPPKADDSSMLAEYGVPRTGRPDVYDALEEITSFTFFVDSASSTPAETARLVEGLTRLATALEMLARRDGLETSLADAFRNLRRATDDLRSAETAEGPPIARKALIMAAAATTELQQRRYPHLARAASSLEAAAAGFRTDRKLADQHDAIALYFDAVNDALMPMILLRR
jgi:hypothetical protein